MSNLITGRLTTILDANNRDLVRKTKDTKRELRDVGRTSTQTNNTLKNVFKGISTTAIVASIGLVGKKIFDLTVEAEKTEVAFQNLLGSKPAGSRLLAQIRELAAATPFTSSKLSEATTRLLAFGVAGKDVVPTLRRLGDVGSATGADIRNLAVVFGQIRSAGRLMGQDLNQLINAGFNPLQVISEKTGRSMSDLKDDMSNGLITFDQVNQAFIDATSEGGKFFRMMETQSGTIGGKLSTLKDNLEQIGRNLGEVVTPFLARVTDNLVKASQALSKTGGSGPGGGRDLLGTAADLALAGAGAFGGVKLARGGAGLFERQNKKMTNKTLKALRDMQGRIKNPPIGSFRLPATKPFTEKELTDQSQVGSYVIAANALSLALQGNILSTKKLKSNVEGMSTGLALLRRGGIIGLISSIRKLSVSAKTLSVVGLAGIIFMFKQVTDQFASFSKEFGLDRGFFGVISDSISTTIKAVVPFDEAIMKFIEPLTIRLPKAFGVAGEAIGKFGRKVSDSFADLVTGGKFSEFINESSDLGAATEIEKPLFKKGMGRAITDSASAFGSPRSAISAFGSPRSAISTDDPISFAIGMRDAGLKIAEDIKNAFPKFESVPVKFPTPFELAGMAASEKAMSDLTISNISSKFLSIFKGLDPFLGNLLGNLPEGDGKLSGAFEMGSVEASAIINQREESSPTKDTAKILEILQAILNGGLKINNIAVAR